MQLQKKAKTENFCKALQKLQILSKFQKFTAFFGNSTKATNIQIKIHPSPTVQKLRKLQNLTKLQKIQLFASSAKTTKYSN